MQTKSSSSHFVPSVTNCVYCVSALIAAAAPDAAWPIFAVFPIPILLIIPSFDFMWPCFNFRALRRT